MNYRIEAATKEEWAERALSGEKKLAILENSIKETHDNDMTKDYVVVTTISSFRHRYVIHKDDLRKMNGNVEPSDAELGEWAMDTVTCEECDEFSQEHMGEMPLDTYECSEDEMLTLFDRDNDYLKGWERDQKIKWVRDTVKNGEVVEVI